VIRVLLVDDEPLALRGLENALEADCGVEIVGTATNGAAAIQAIRSLTPEVVFLDIQMPGLNGLEVASAISTDCAPEVIFVTAFEQYAVEAFAVEAVDYLLKPIEAGRVLQSIQRVRRRRAALATLKTDFEFSNTTASLHFPDRHGGFSIPQSEIVWIEAAKDYALVHTEKRSYMLRTTMADLADQLQPPLRRVHRSAYVAIDRVQRTVSSGKGVFSVILNGDIEVQVGPSYARAIRSELGHLDQKDC
jgi:DNA-binding LytR/AlgR family response regulator